MGNINTRKLISNTALRLEYLYSGGYGKDNIKADFLGYTKRIYKVEDTEVDLTEKLVVAISSQKGCRMNCNFCDCSKLKFEGNASYSEMMYQIWSAIAFSRVTHTKKLNLYFVRMGEPTFNSEIINVVGDMINSRFVMNSVKNFNPNISTMLPKTNNYLISFITEYMQLCLDTKTRCGLQLSINTLDNDKRQRMFNWLSLDLDDIKSLLESVVYRYVRDRKITLNFAVNKDSDLSVDKMNKYFDKEKCVVKITPIHKTKSVKENGIDTNSNFDVYEKFEQPLVKDGWDVIVSLFSKEEEEEKITCGNSLLKTNNLI